MNLGAPVHNADIARAFDEIADLLELGNENPFRIRAYRNAARIVGDAPFDVAALIRTRALPKLPGVGADLAAKMDEIVRTGRCALHERLRAGVPPGVLELLRLPGVGPKRARVLWHELGVHTVAQLRRAAERGRVRELAGFGSISEQKLLDASRAHLGRQSRLELAVAAQYAEPYAAYLRHGPRVREVVIAGSYRRVKETVGDIDMLVIAEDPDRAVEHFVTYPEVTSVIAHGRTRASVVLACGLHVDLRVMRKDCFGAALHYFTGSKAHNIAIRRIARDLGLKINEYGVFRGKKRIAGETEESLFASVGLPWIPPELREDEGEIEAARHLALPELVTERDLYGDLHAHTTATDGRNRLREMAEAARARGLRYLAITDHSRRMAMAHGLDPARLARQMREIDRLNDELTGITLLKGIEVDVLEDGRLDLPDSVLAKLDLVIGAVHTKFDLSRGAQTQRIMNALDRPYFSILAHPSGRLIGSREPYELDLPAVVRKAAERGVALELNAHPERLDLTDVHCRMARDAGVLVSIGSDAHSVHDFDHLRFGVGQARRGWLRKEDVLNTRPLAEVRRWLHATMGGRRRARRTREVA